MEKEILIELTLGEKKTSYLDMVVYKFEPYIKEISATNDKEVVKTFYYDWVCFHNNNNNVFFANASICGSAFIGANDISLEEVKKFVQEFFKGLIGGSIGEIGFKTSFFFNQYDQFASYWLGSGFADFKGAVSGKSPRETLKELKLVSAQKGNRFYHEEEILDLASWQPENPEDFELYLCFHLVFEDETVLVYRTWATRNRVIDSYNRYVSETKKRILWMYPFTVAEAGYDLSYWDKFIKEEVSLFPAMTKTESAIKQYMEYGFEPANYYEEYLTQKLSTSEDTYVFKGNVEIIEEMID